MSSTTLTFSQLARHVPEAPSSPFGFRELVRRPIGPLSLQVQLAPFSVMTQNMALLIAPGDYLGTNRKRVVAEISSRIRSLSPDVVGLCEVFSDDERENIRRALHDIYPYFQESPDEDDLGSDGGLLVLSKYPFLVTGAFIYRDCDGFDCFANKGMIHIRVKSSSCPTAFDVFYTHAQDISTDDGVSTLYAQLAKMQEFIQQRADPTLPAIVMGDLNIPAENPQHYTQLLNQLTGVRDCWTIVGNSVESGSTYVKENNFYEDVDDRPSRDERLDYVVLRAGTRAIPIVSDIEILKFTCNGRFISDHFRIRVAFRVMAFLYP